MRCYFPALVPTSPNWTMSTSLYSTAFAYHSVPDAAVCGAECCSGDPRLDIPVAADFHRRPMNRPVREALGCKSDLSALWESALQPLEMRFRLFAHEQNCIRNPTEAYSKRDVTANLSKGAFLWPFAAFTCTLIINQIPRHLIILSSTSRKSLLFRKKSVKLVTFLAR